jgi:hypothetical protein
LELRNTLRASCWVIVESRDPLVFAERHDQRAGQAKRIDAEVRVEAAILHRDHCVLHHLRDFVGMKPLAVARAERDDLASVARAHDDRLADLAVHQRGVAGHVARGEIDRRAEREQQQRGERAAPHEQAPEPDPPPRRRRRRWAAPSHGLGPVTGSRAPLLKGHRIWSSCSAACAALPSRVAVHRAIRTQR